MAEPFAMVRGRVIRVTRLSPDGSSHPSGDYVTTNAVARVEVVERTYSHSDSPDVDDQDRVVFVPHEWEETVGYTVDIDLLRADPDILNIVSGNPLITDAEDTVVGFGVDALVEPPTFALEIWTRLAQPCANGSRWGYTLFPRLTGGRLTGLSMEKALVQFRISGASCQRAPIWEPVGASNAFVPGFGEGGFGAEPFGYGGEPNGGLWFGLGPFGVAPFDAAESPETQVITHNRFWMTQTVQGHPAPYRQIAG